jgi:predicted transcriptional regulator
MPKYDSQVTIKLTPDLTERLKTVAAALNKETPEVVQDALRVFEEMVRLHVEEKVTFLTKDEKGNLSPFNVFTTD